MNILDELKKNTDEEYRIFQQKLAPTMKLEECLGVRIPKVREIYKNIKGTDALNEFLYDLPHTYYDENMLESIALCDIKTYEEAMLLVEKFLPYINNWAVCDTLVPKVFKKNKLDLLEHIKVWIKSDKEYVVRYSLITLMKFFLDDDFSFDILDMVNNIKDTRYYVQMAMAWFYCDALIKQYDSTIKVIESKKLDKWVHNKAISKAIESFRISDDVKEYLKSLKQ